MTRYRVQGLQRGGPPVSLKSTDSAREALAFTTAGNSPFASVVVHDNTTGQDLTAKELRALAKREADK